MRYLLFIVLLSGIARSQDLQEVYDLYNNGQRDSAWQVLNANEKTLFEAKPVETAYLFARVGWVVYSEHPNINCPARIKAIEYTKTLFEIGDSIYKSQATSLMIDLMTSVNEDMEVVLEDYSSSINRTNEYLDHFSPELIPLIPVLVESGFIEDGKMAYNYGVVLNTEAEKLLLKAEKMTATPKRDELEEKSAILYVAAFRLLNSACSLGENYCDLSGFDLIDDPASKSSINLGPE